METVAPTSAELSNDSSIQEVHIQFISTESQEVCGSSIRVPLNISTQSMTDILFQLRQLQKNHEDENENCPEVYNFFVGAQQYQVIGSLQQTLEEWKLSIQSLLDELSSKPKDNNDSAAAQPAEAMLVNKELCIPIMYEPQATYRVRAVTRCSSSLPGHDAIVTTLHFNPDGSLLASAGGDCLVRFWDMDNELPHSRTPEKIHLKPIQVLQWSPCGSRLASGDMAGHVAIWEMRQQQDCMETSTSATGASLWKLVNNKKLTRGNAPKIEKLRWTRAMSWKPYHLDPSCRLLAVSYQDGAIHIWDCVMALSVIAFSGHSLCVPALRWGGTNLIYTVSHDQTIKVWRADDGVLCRTLKSHSHWINCLALNVDAALRTAWWDANAAASAERRRKRTNNSDLSDVEMTEKEKQEMAQKRYMDLLAGLPERLVVGSDDCTLSMWEPETQTKAVNKRMTGHMAVVNDVKFSPDARLIASASFDKSIKIWDGKNGNFLSSLYGHVQDAYLVAWSPDSRLLISASKDSTLQVFTIEQVRRKQTIKEGDKFKNIRHHLHNLFGHSDQVYALDWAPNGQRVASAGADCLVKIWRP